MLLSFILRIALILVSCVIVALLVVGAYLVIVDFYELLLKLLAVIAGFSIVLGTILYVYENDDI